MLTAKRMREHATLFASLLGVVAILCGLGVGLTGYLTTSATDGVRADLASRTGAAVGLQLSLVRDADAEGQDAAVREALAASFVTDGRPVPFAVDRSVSPLSSAVPFVRLDAAGSVADLAPEEDPAEPAEDGRSMVLSVPDLPDRTELVEGSWPAATTEASIQADAAALLGLAPGDRIRLGGAEVTITGTWRVLDPLDPFWLGDELVTTGSDKDDIGPIIVDESVWTPIGVTAWARWTLIPITDQIAVGDLATITEVWNELPRTFRSVSDVDVSTLNRDGRLARTAVEIDSRVHALEAVQPIALIILGAIAVIAILELARLLAGVRSGETELLWSRGASASALMRSTALESAVAATLGAILGTAGAALVLGVVGGRPDAVLSAGSSLWAMPASAILGTIAVFAFTSFRAGRRPLGRDTATVSGRARSIAGAGGVVLVVAAALISTWQLVLYGSPLTPTANGGLEVDPIAVLSPALGIVAVVLVGLIAFPRVVPLVERAARNGTGATGILAARSVARRLQFAATPIVLLALACGQLVVGAAYASTWSNAYDQTAQLRSGTAVRVITGLGGLSGADLEGVLATDSVGVVAPVRASNAAVADDYASLVSATPLTIARLANDAKGALDPALIAEQITAPRYAPEVPEGATGIRLVLETIGHDAAPIVIARLTDPLGNPIQVPLSATEQASGESSAEGSRTWGYDGDLTAPTGGGGWLLLALDVHADPSDLERAVVLDSLAAVGGEAAGELELGERWIGRSFVPGESIVVDALTNGLDFPMLPGMDLLRLLPSFNGEATDGLLAPIVISAALAQRYSLEVGNTFPVGIVDSTNRTACVIMAIIPGVPAATTEASVLMDSAIVDGLLLRDDDNPAAPRQFWVDTDQPAAVASALRADLPPQVRIDALALDPARVMLSSAVTALLVGALGAALLAVVAVSTVAGAQLRSRRAEVVILRAVGLSSRSLASIRRRELMIVLAYGIVVGLVSGTTITAIVLASLARAAVPAPYANLATTVQVDVPLLALGLLLLAGLLAAVLGLYGMRVAAQARTLSAREEVR